MATQKFHDAGGQMTQLYRKIIHVNIRWSIVDKVTVLRRFFRFICERVLICSARMPNTRYRRLSPSIGATESNFRKGEDHGASTSGSGGGYESDSDLVSLKISVLGDCEIGKTTFVIKYVGGEEEKKSLQLKGLNLMGKLWKLEVQRLLSDYGMLEVTAGREIKFQLLAKML